MTGAEIVGAATAAAGKAAKQVLSESDGTEAQLSRLAEATPEMRAAARAYAARVAIRQQLVLQIMRPLGRLAGFSKAYFENTFSDELAEKLAAVPEDQVQSPPANVAVPAMQGLGYSLEEPDLKEMYLNLLANASDKRKSTETHPAFSEVIKQLSASEARLLGQVLHAGQHPIAKVKKSVPPAGFNIVHHCILSLVRPVTGEQVENPQLSAWVDNWVRLGLVERDFGNFFTDAGRYAWIEKRPEVIRLKEAGENVSYDRGLLRATDFGRRFATAVGSDERANEESKLWRALREAAKSEDTETASGAVAETATDCRGSESP